MNVALSASLWYCGKQTDIITYCRKTYVNCLWSCVVDCAITRILFTLNKNKNLILYFALVQLDILNFEKCLI